jgi:hypothetical protein
MGFIDEIRKTAASSRITEEALYAEALREIEAGIRRDGLWAKALAESGMDPQDARGKYLKLRVQSLRDELELAAHSTKMQTKHRLVDKHPRASDEVAGVERGSWKLGEDGLKVVLGGLALVFWGYTLNQESNFVLRALLFGVGITAILGGGASMVVGIVKALRKGVS